MTKEEIKALIAEKIAGQGNQVDSGGALANILNAITDAVFAAATGEPAYVFESLETAENVTKEQFLEATGGVTLEQLKAATHIKVANSILTRMEAYTDYVIFGYEFSGYTLDAHLCVKFSHEGSDTYSINVYEQ